LEKILRIFVSLMSEETSLPSFQLTQTSTKTKRSTAAL
jgi:hypothetical protein